MEEPAVLELEITDVAHGGIVVARHDGRVVFVSDAIPGERVRARVADASKASFWRADTLEVLEASPDRRARHVWPEADLARDPRDRPGGADFGHITLERQRALKADVLRDALRRFGGVGWDVEVEPVSGEDAEGRGWRTRLSLHVDAEGAVGPVAARSHRVVPVATHPLATPEISAAAAALPPAAPGRVDLVQPGDGRVRIVPRPDRPGRSRHSPRRGTDDAGSEVVVEEAAGRSFALDAGGFWQVHRGAARTLAGAVAEALRGASFEPQAANLDLYGGVGLFAGVMADVGGPGTRVVTVESAPRATSHAVRNLADAAGVEAVTARVDRYLAGAEPAPRAERQAATVLLDPPRAGAGTAVVEAIAAREPRTVLYVACDPVALARDMRTFGLHGYEPTSVRAFDLFPNSHHVEALAVLQRRR
ncbi:class I SAM-dependent RNA methyltransferase [Microbacterium sp. NPDC078428]|uniref:class I SAM-dependent RNA methyltransferase n=1 Tax=Microbacterium sp. NPDC078428 TaxID=3364190 RepID=UPI0037C9AE5A